jgi:hypothetical protein
MIVTFYTVVAMECRQTAIVVFRIQESIEETVEEQSLGSNKTS